MAFHTMESGTFEDVVPLAPMCVENHNGAHLHGNDTLKRFNTFLLHKQKCWFRVYLEGMEKDGFGYLINFSSVVRGGNEPFFSFYIDIFLQNCHECMIPETLHQN